MKNRIPPVVLTLYIVLFALLSALTVFTWRLALSPPHKRTVVVYRTVTDTNWVDEYRIHDVDVIHHVYKTVLVAPKAGPW